MFKYSFFTSTFSFFKIGLNDVELNKFNKLIQQNKNYLNILFTNFKKINNLMNIINTIKRNYYIYDNGQKNNYKNYYMYILETMNEQLINNLNVNIRYKC